MGQLVTRSSDGCRGWRVCRATILATSVDWIGLRKDPAVAYLNIAIRHSVHHRGQLSAYLRPMGARVEDCLYLNIWTPAKSAGEKRRGEHH